MNELVGTVGNYFSLVGRLPADVLFIIGCTIIFAVIFSILLTEE